MNKESSESFAALFEGGSAGQAPRRYRAGERVEARVVAIGRDAVFADLGGKEEALFERGEFVDDDGGLTVAIGDVVAAVVQGYAEGQVQLAPLSVRSGDTIPDLEGSPYQALESSSAFRAKPLLVEGARISGTVSRIERYGIFVQIQGTQGRAGQGLVPNAETATPRGADLRKHFTVGDAVDAKILSVEEDGKIRMSIKALSADAERADYQKYSSSKPEGGRVRGFGTIGSLSAGSGKGTLADKLGVDMSSGHAASRPPPRHGTPPPPKDGYRPASTRDEEQPPASRPPPSNKPPPLRPRRVVSGSKKRG